MGQYYEVYTKDTKGAIKIFSPTGGLKIMEHSWWKNDFVNAIATMLNWDPHRVAWIGDYAEPDDCMGTEECIKMEAMEMVNSIFDMEEASLEVNKEGQLSEENKVLQLTMDNKFLINHTKKEFINLTKYYKQCVDSDGWCIHPLPLLTAVGNGRGGGDYYSENGAKDVGRWAFDLLEIDDLPPQLSNTCKGAALMQPEYKEICPFFQE